MLALRPLLAAAAGRQQPPSGLLAPLTALSATSTPRRPYSKKKIPPRDWPHKIVSGIQPTGVLHLGNYLGAITRWRDLQDSGADVSYFIADMHSITLPQDPAELRHNILQMTATLLACGIDADKSTLFLQSTVAQHAELGWIFGCLTTMARLGHLPQYREKSATVKEIPLGLFVYPVLQAADILMYKATHVPCGDDQAQQLQLAQHLAQVFNFRFGETFPVCHGLIADDASARIKSLRDPTKKMSKSDPDPKTRLVITDRPEQIVDKVKKALTDFTSAVTYEPELRPGVANLLTIHSLMAGEEIDAIVERMRGLDTGKYKLQVADAVVAHMEPIRRRLEELMANPDYLVATLRRGGDRAAETAQRTIEEVKQKVGLGLPADRLAEVLAVEKKREQKQ